MTYWSGQIGPLPAAVSDGAARTASWLMTSRRGGISQPPFDGWNLAAHVGDDPAAVAANRQAVADFAGADTAVFMRQCHSAEVAIVDSSTVTEVVGVDALVTREPGVVVVALAADCVPVALMDVQAGVVAAVHSGWQGMVSDVVGAALSTMTGLGADVTRIRAVLGPAICGRCYPVPPERVDEAALAVPESRAVAADGQPAIDVRHGLVARLERAGVWVETAGGCTAEDPESFSYRRDGRTGRQGVAVWWN